MAVSGPLIARFYGEPKLTWIAVVSALTFVMSALSVQHSTLLRRAMKFKELAHVEISANLFSAAGAITMAFCGLEYWALAIRPVLLSFFIALGVWFSCRWVPGRPVLSAGAKEMLSQGLHGTAFQITDYVAFSSDRVAIGYWSGPIALGYYQNAIYIYENLCALLVLSAHNVAAASLGKAQNDLNELRRLWRKALSMLEFYAMPAFGILAVTGQDLVILLFGSKWAQAGVLISILAWRGIPHSVERTMGWLHVAAGRIDRWMRWGIIAMFAQLIAILSGVSYGPVGVSVALVICSFILFIPAVAYSGRPLGVTVMDVVSTVWRPLATSLLAAVIGFALRFTLLTEITIILRIAILASVYLAVYLTIMVFIFGEHMPMQVLFGLARDILPSRIARYMPFRQPSR